MPTTEGVGNSWFTERPLPVPRGSSTGPDDTSHLEGNDFAEDNPGGGPPENNSNAEVHGSWSDPHTFYQRLEGERKKYVDDLTECYIEQSKADFPDEEIRDKARELAVMPLLSDGAACYLFDRGWSVEREREIDGQTITFQALNPALEADIRISRKERRLMRELRVYDTPNGLPWSEQ